MKMKMKWKVFKKSKKSNSIPSVAEKSEMSRASDGQERFRARVFMLMIAFSQWFQVKAQPVLRKVDWSLVRISSFILALSFVGASSVSTFAADIALNMVSGAGKSDKKGADKSEEIVVQVAAVVRDSSGLSAGELKKSILARNLFNSEGTLAPEADEGAGGLTKTKGLNFDVVPCMEEKLPVEIVGTIFTGDPKKSFVSVKDSKVPDADIYKSGDLIIEHEEYEIYKVTRGTVELRKGDQKICVDLKGFERNKGGPSAPSVPGAPQSVKPENVETLEFDSNYIAQEIGPGYSNILNSAKLIPEVEGGNKIAGFKIIAIAPGSLFDKMKLTNGDVISEVNGVSLRDASQGFKLYQSLQEEREITVNIIRSGEPMTRKVRVK